MSYKFQVDDKVRIRKKISLDEATHVAGAFELAEAWQANKEPLEIVDRMLGRYLGAVESPVVPIYMCADRANNLWWVDEVGLKKIK